MAFPWAIAGAGALLGAGLQAYGAGRAKAPKFQPPTYEPPAWLRRTIRGRALRGIPTPPEIERLAYARAQRTGRQAWERAVRDLQIAAARAGYAGTPVHLRQVAELHRRLQEMRRGAIEAARLAEWERRLREMGRATTQALNLEALRAGQVAAVTRALSAAYPILAQAEVYRRIAPYMALAGRLSDLLGALAISRALATT